MVFKSAIICLIVAGLCHIVPLLADEIYTNCANDNNLGMVTEVQLDDCTETPCTLHRNSTVEILVGFIPYFTVDYLSLNVYGLIETKYYKYKYSFINNANACDESYNIKCPIEEKERQIFKMEVEIKSYYPQWELSVIAALSDENSGYNIVCIGIDVNIE
ncbi:hypothetical protein LOD99_11601 [Oopsacas minuta]|uniref:MD-2-related lipid-recognition domain-containing protein n=1 Tax=Oopsacas minuta TaxID=111878 RepID=A0AAV7JL44_9METZ|nr:hypothetical protein LOD99_11601 [Oopsacas minuta]